MPVSFLSTEQRGNHNRLGFALQLTTVRFLGTFLEQLTDVPSTVLHSLSKQLAMDGIDGLADYAQAEQRWAHADADASARHVVHVA